MEFKCEFQMHFILYLEIQDKTYLANGHFKIHILALEEQKWRKKIARSLQAYEISGKWIGNGKSNKQISSMKIHKCKSSNFGMYTKKMLVSKHVCYCGFFCSILTTVNINTILCKNTYAKSFHFIMNQMQKRFTSTY